MTDDGLTPGVSDVDFVVVSGESRKGGTLCPLDGQANNDDDDDEDEDD